MGLFKRAAVRGIAHELVRRKMAQFPTKQALDEAADAVADHMPETGPEVSPEGGHSPETVVAIANRLMEIAQQLMAEASGGGAGGMPPGMPGAEAGPGGPPPPPEALAAKEGAEQLFKFAAESDYETVASNVAVELMDKAAEEAKQAGSLIQGGDKGNDAAQSKKVTEIGALDQKNRPDGAYHHGVGKTELDTNKGNIGDHEKHDKQPGASPSGSNSLTQNVGKKSAALDAAISKIAGSLTQVNRSPKNDITNAANLTEIGKLDKENRPAGYAHVGQGNANFSESQSARIGKEEPHPHQPKNSPSGTNSVIQASKAAEELSDDEKAYVSIFSKCAADVGPYLPEKMDGDQKIAAIRHMMGMEHDERQTYLDALNKSASELSEAMHAMKGDEGKKHQEHEKHESPAKEKKEEAAVKEEKKEGALMEQIRKIASATSAQPRP